VLTIPAGLQEEHPAMVLKERYVFTLIGRLAAGHARDESSNDV
jgi:hypothetical protein